MDEKKYERVKMVLPVRIAGHDANGQPFSLLAHTLDFSRTGARIGGVRVSLQVDEEITVEYKRQRGRFVVRWVGTRYDIDVENLNPDKFVFMELPEGSYREVSTSPSREKGPPVSNYSAKPSASPAVSSAPAKPPAEERAPATAPVALTPEAAGIAEVKRLLRDHKGDIDAVLQLVTTRLHGLLAANGAAIALLEGEDWICRASSGVAPRIGVRFQSPQGLTGEAASSGAVAVCRDTEVDPRVNRYIWRSVQLRSAASAPLLRDTSVIGVLEVFAEQPDVFSEPKTAVLREVAGALAATVSGTGPAHS